MRMYVKIIILNKVFRYIYTYTYTNNYVTFK